DVNLIIPTIDEELPVFGRSKQRFERSGIQVAVSSEHTSNVCNDKFETYLFCKRKGIRTPVTRLGGDFDLGSLQFPLYVKPRTGQDSVNVFAVQNEAQLRLFLNYVPDAIVQDYLPGTEFTVDVLADFNGRILSIVPRERVVIRAGVTD